MKIPDEESNCGTVLLPAVGSHNQQEHGSKPANISLPSKRRLRNAQYRPSPVESSSRSQGNFRTCYVMPLDNASLILKGQSRSSDLMFSGGGEGNRTPDTGIFSPLLYQLSYPAKMPALASLYILTKDMPLSTLYSDETPIF